MRFFHYKQSVAVVSVLSWAQRSLQAIFDMIHSASFWYLLFNLSLPNLGLEIYTIYSLHSAFCRSLFNFVPVKWSVRKFPRVSNYTVEQLLHMARQIGTLLPENKIFWFFSRALSRCPVNTTRSFRWRRLLQYYSDRHDRQSLRCTAKKYAIFSPW